MSKSLLFLSLLFAGTAFATDVYRSTGTDDTTRDGRSASMAYTTGEDDDDSDQSAAGTSTFGIYTGDGGQTQFQPGTTELYIPINPGLLDGPLMLGGLVFTSNIPQNEVTQGDRQASEVWVLFDGVNTLKDGFLAEFEPDLPLWSDAVGALEAEFPNGIGHLTVLDQRITYYDDGLPQGFLDNLETYATNQPRRYGYKHIVDSYGYFGGGLTTENTGTDAWMHQEMRWNGSNLWIRNLWAFSPDFSMVGPESMEDTAAAAVVEPHGGRSSAHAFAEDHAHIDLWARTVYRVKTMQEYLNPSRMEYYLMPPSDFSY